MIAPDGGRGKGFASGKCLDQSSQGCRSAAGIRLLPRRVRHF